MKRFSKNRLMRTVLGIISAVILMSGCGGGNGGSGGGSDPITFPVDYKTAYAFVRDCRNSIDHAGIGGVKVYINPESAAAFAALWAAPNVATPLPVGTILVKEVYAASTDCSGSMTGWVAMKKEPSGYNPSKGDWHWQLVGVNRTVINGEDGIVDRCINCHDGSQGGCIGLGGINGYDYTCTAHLPTDP
jgi:hypothetical protein